MHFVDPQNYLYIMRTFLNHVKNETLDEIKTSLENLWQGMIQLSEFFQYSFVLILKRKCLVRASRVRCGESGTPSIIIYTRWSSRRYKLGCDAPVMQSTPAHIPTSPILPPHPFYLLNPLSTTPFLQHAQPLIQLIFSPHLFSLPTHFSSPLPCLFPLPPHKNRHNIFFQLQNRLQQHKIGPVVFKYGNKLHDDNTRLTCYSFNRSASFCESITLKSVINYLID